MARLALAALPGTDPGRRRWRSRPRLQPLWAVLESPRVRSLLVIDAIGESHRVARTRPDPGPVPPSRAIRGAGSSTAIFFALVTNRLRCTGTGAPIRRDRGGHRPLAPARAAPRPRPASTMRPAPRGSPDTCAPGGVFALWSNDPPDADYQSILAGVLTDVSATVVSFANPVCRIARRPTRSTWGRVK